MNATIEELVNVEEIGDKNCRFSSKLFFKTKNKILIENLNLKIYVLYQKFKK